MFLSQFFLTCTGFLSFIFFYLLNFCILFHLPLYLHKAKILSKVVFAVNLFFPCPFGEDLHSSFARFFSINGYSILRVLSHLKICINLLLFLKDTWLGTKFGASHCLSPKFCKHCSSLLLLSLIWSKGLG